MYLSLRISYIYKYSQVLLMFRLMLSMVKLFQLLNHFHGEVAYILIQTAK